MMFEKSLLGPPPLTNAVRGMLAIWFVILVPWLPVVTLMGTGMAFDGGYKASAYLSVFTGWIYPALVAMAWFSRRKKPNRVWLPFLTLVPLIVGEWV